MEIKKLEGLIELVPELERGDFGEWADTGVHEGTSEDPIPMPHVDYAGGLDGKLIEAIYAIAEANLELGLKDYAAILERYNLEWSDDSLCNADISELDSVCILAMILSIIRADRFDEGVLLRYLDNGMILKWVKRLQELADI